jgi:hypothetical protein
VREQLVSQVDRGAVLSKRYFASAALCDETGSVEFKEVSEDEVVSLGLAKTNSFKNFKSKTENRFCELNLYKRDPGSPRRLPLNPERPGDIDL